MTLFNGHMTQVGQWDGRGKFKTSSEKKIYWLKKLLKYMWGSKLWFLFYHQPGGEPQWSEGS